MRLVAEISDADLLFSLLHSLGSTFYVEKDKGQVEVLYFSGNRIVHYTGKLDKDKMELLRAMGWRVKHIEVDEATGTVKITQ